MKECEFAIVDGKSKIKVVDSGRIIICNGIRNKI
jgi:hypothetical protein